MLFKKLKDFGKKNNYEVIEGFPFHKTEFKTEVALSMPEDETVVALSVPEDEILIEVLRELGNYLESENFEDEELELSNPVFEKYGDKQVILFPYCRVGK